MERLKKLGEQTVKILNMIDRLTEEYSDTISLILITVGGLLATVAVGELPHGGTTSGYSFVYIKHPVNLMIGLIGIVVGFTLQLWDNLVLVHKIEQKKIFWLTTVVFISLLLLVVLN